LAVQAPCYPLQQRGEVLLARELRKLAAILAADVVGYSRRERY
jgi:class 3 adenylate cyclase